MLETTAHVFSPPPPASPALVTARWSPVAALPRRRARFANQGLSGSVLLPLWVALSLVGCTYDYAGLTGARGTGSSSGQGGGGSGGDFTRASGGATGSGGTHTGSGGTGVDNGGSGGNDSDVITGPGSGGRSDGGGRGGGINGVAGRNASGGGQGGVAVVLGGGGMGPGGLAGGGAGSGAGGGSGPGGGSPDLSRDPDLVLWYKFDEASGSVAADSSAAAGGPRHGTLAVVGVGGAVAFSSARQVGSGSVALTANGTAGGGYVTIPPLGTLAPQAITVSAWINFTSASRWQRVFEVGNSTLLNMALTTTDTTEDVRFVIRTSGTATEQLITTATRLSLSQWHHLVVVLPAGLPYVGQLFVDGVLAGSNSAMTFHPADLGVTTNNYLGRSVFPTYPYFPGAIDDFRVYRRALQPSEVAALFLVR